MVCRENKGRSTAIRLVKELNKTLGLGPMHDREGQSLIHQRKHEFEGAPDMSTEEQIALWQGVRQQIENSHDIPDREKYRQSARQPGMITRIDEEIQRLRTGTRIDSKGRERPLETKHRNSGADLQSIQYLGTWIPRIQQAKAEYFELNARHTGRTVQAVEAQWNGIMAREGDGRGSVGISLRDSWRDDLAVAGFSAQSQADVGQSARARQAIAELEAHRHQILAAQPQRPTIRAEQRTRYVSSKTKNVKCDACGQFGHDEPACPNQKLVDERFDVTVQHLEPSNDLKAAIIDRSLNDPQVSHAERAALEHERDRFRAQGTGNTTASVSDIEGQLRRLANDDSRIQQQMAANGPKVSSWINEVAYSEESGLMEVTVSERRRKDGIVVPATTYRYRVSKQDADRILASDEVGAELNRTVMRRGKNGDNAAFKWENESDAAAAAVQHKCPTCGRWASMTSSHQCPVPGSTSATGDLHNRATLAQWRHTARSAKALGLEPPEKPAPRIPAPGTQRRNLAGGGSAHIPRREQVLAITDSGQIASPTITINKPDATVSGQMTVWTDPSGQRLASPLASAGGTGLRCTCEQYRANGRCPHIKDAAAVMARDWGAMPMLHSGGRPGVTLDELRRDTTSDTAFDAPRTELSNRMDYGRISGQRNEKIGNHVAGLYERRRACEPINGPRVKPPTDPEGQPVQWPTTFERDGGGGADNDRPVDLSNTADIQYRLRAGLYARTREHWSVLRDKDGGMRITVPKSRRASDGSIPRAERDKLCQALNIPARSSRADGVYIPADTSWRHEFLSRAYGDEPPIRASRFSVA